MKNTTETFSVPVRALFPAGTNLSEESLKECLDIEKRRDKGKDFKQGVEKIRAELNDISRRIMDSLAVDLPTDPVEINVSVGSFFLDLYLRANQPPTAPIARALYQSKIRDLSENLRQDEITLSDELKNQAKKTLEESHLWDTLNITGWVEANGQKRFLVLNNSIVPRIPTVFQDVMNVFAPEIIKEAEGGQG